MATLVAASYGLDIFDVQFRRESGGMVLRIQLDRQWSAEGDAKPEALEDSVSVDECAKVSRDLSAVFDVEEVVPAAYILEVSSPGLDRPLRKADDYRRFAGRRAKVVLRQAVDGQMFFKGRLGGLDAGTTPSVIIDGDDRRQHRVPLGLITRANLEVEF